MATNSVLRFLPRTLFSQGAEWVDENGKWKEELKSTGKGYKFMIGLVITLLGSKVVIEAAKRIGRRVSVSSEKHDQISKFRRQLEAMISFSSSDEELNTIFQNIKLIHAKAGAVLTASTLSTLLLHITGHMKGRSLRGHYRLRSGGFRFVDSRGTTWELKHVSSGKRWRLTRKASADLTVTEQSWGFTNPASWYPGETQVVAGARVTPRTVQRIMTFKLTNNQTLATAAPDSTETFDISSDRDQDAEIAAFAIYLARVEGTVSIGMIIMLFSILGTAANALSMLTSTKVKSQKGTKGMAFHQNKWNDDDDERDDDETDSSIYSQSSLQSLEDWRYNHDGVNADGF